MLIGNKGESANNYPGRSTSELVNEASALLGDMGASIAAFPTETIGLTAAELQQQANQQASTWLQESVPAMRESVPPSYTQRAVEPETVPNVHPRSFGQMATREMVTASRPVAGAEQYQGGSSVVSQAQRDQIAYIAKISSEANTNGGNVGFGVNLN